MGWGSSNPQPHPTLTTQMETLKPREGNRRLTVTQPASCLGSVFWPGCLAHTDLGLNLRSSIHLLYSLSFLGHKMDMIRTPCSLHCGGHIWKTHVAEGPVPPGAPPESQGTPQSHQHKLPSQPQNPKAQPSQCTLPRKGRQPRQGHTARPQHTGTRTGPCTAEPPTLQVDLAEPRRCQGLSAARGGREAGRQLGVVGRAFSPLSLANPDPRLQAALQSP